MVWSSATGKQIGFKLICLLLASSLSSWQNIVKKFDLNLFRANEIKFKSTLCSSSNNNNNVVVNNRKCTQENETNILEEEEENWFLLRTSRESLSLSKFSHAEEFTSSGREKGSQGLAWVNLENPSAKLEVASVYIVFHRNVVVLASQRTNQSDDRKPR